MSNIDIQLTRKIEKNIPGAIQDALMAKRWITKQSLGLQIHLKEKSLELFSKLLKKYPECTKAEVSIIAELKIALKAYNLHNSMKRKNSRYRSDDLVLMNLLEATVLFQQKPRVSKKLNYLKSHISKIVLQQNLGYSLRDIAQTLETPDGGSISYEYLRKFLIEYEGAQYDS